MIWKRLNPNTGEYEVIPGTGTNTENSNETIAMPDLTGKTIIFMGDSYTAGMSGIAKSMCAEFKANADIYGVVSSSIAGDREGNKGFSPMWVRTQAVCQNYTSAGTEDDVAAVVFMGGANDGFGKTTWLGSGINDRDNLHIYGAMHTILGTFRKTFNCPVFVILQPTFPNGSLPTDITEENAKIWGFDSVEQCQSFDADMWCQYAMTLKQNVVLDVAKYYGCKIVDCFFDHDISIWNSVERGKYWNADGHPSAAGYEKIVDRLKEKMVEYFAN